MLWRVVVRRVAAPGSARASSTVPAKKTRSTVVGVLAVAAYTHWELGDYNRQISSKTKGVTWSKYVDMILATIARVFGKIGNNKLSKKFKYTILRLCMAVGCADVAASSNAELDQAVIPFHISAETHLTGGGAWVQYDFRNAHKKCDKSHQQDH